MRTAVSDGCRVCNELLARGPTREVADDPPEEVPVPDAG